MENDIQEWHDEQLFAYLADPYSPEYENDDWPDDWEELEERARLEWEAYCRTPEYQERRERQRLEWEAYLRSERFLFLKTRWH